MVGPIPSSSGLYSKQQTGAIVIHAVPGCTLRILLRVSVISAIDGVYLPLCSGLAEHTIFPQLRSRCLVYGFRLLLLPWLL